MNPANREEVLANAAAQLPRVQGLRPTDENLLPERGMVLGKLCFVKVHRKSIELTVSTVKDRHARLCRHGWGRSAVQV